MVPFSRGPPANLASTFPTPPAFRSLHCYSALQSYGIGQPRATRRSPDSKRLEGKVAISLSWAVHGFISIAKTVATKVCGGEKRLQTIPNGGIWGFVGVRL
ncbi:hypothetical protein AVEN_151866-1 [Araneus ventricosus]|uniref:Uncharacterized protein n=1 Tax=Araneus ventricosus TaxID=182803 RepID=A0A4Y2PXJ6_ARAVE|nr:hypothetical protein AVEN_151866-1 [Araneus ventricosus]